MSKYLEIYNGNPTAGDVDGTPVSEGTWTNPVNCIVDGEDCYIKLAARCRETFHVDGDITIAVKSDDGNLLLAVDDGYDADTVKKAAFSSSIVISGLAGVNKIFWLKCAKDAATGTGAKLEVSAPIKKENAS